ncbi:MAG: DNA repair protein RecO [Phycisphaerae bacterium]|nr:DNA repair protein RecO [Phycisphaerae bacterium]
MLFSILKDMSLQTDDALVLRRLDYSESSQIIVLFTRRHGRLRLIAKGSKHSSKKKFAAGLELLETGQVVWFARPDRLMNLATLTEWQPQRSFLQLRESLPRLYAGQYLAEISGETLQDGDPHEELFEALVQHLAELETSLDTLPLVCSYQRVLLEAIGLLPQTEACCNCRRTWRPPLPERLYFSAHQGGFICPDCEMTQVEKRLTHRTTFQSLTADFIDQSATTALFDLYDYHLAHLIGRQPRLSDFVLAPHLRRQWSI